MTKSIKQNKMLHAGIIFYLGMFMLTSFSCKSTTSNEAVEANITVSNECGAAVDIFMDGIFQFSLEYLDHNTILDINLGTHELEAKKKGTDTLVSSDSAEINEYADYVWTVLSSATIVITNAYGETLSIYGDGNLQGDIEDQQSETLDRVPYGEHLLEATKPGESTVLASINIDITENKEYTWTISK